MQRQAWLGVWECRQRFGLVRGRRCDEIAADDAEIAGDDVASTSAPDLDCPVLRVAPYRTFAGHTADVLDLAWSKSQFLLTASMDKTVRLWHISMDDCLRVFK